MTWTMNEFLAAVDLEAVKVTVKVVQVIVSNADNKVSKQRFVNL